MSRLTRRFFCLAVLAVSISLLAACQKTTPSTPDLPDLKVGVVGVEQPKGTKDGPLYSAGPGGLGSGCGHVQ